jgi:acyl-CoA reductase-like NAD-dependent aldehyde dehydrogenase
MDRANNNDLGLCSYVYTTDLKKANKASEQLESGCVAGEYSCCSCSRSTLWWN